MKYLYLFIQANTGDDGCVNVDIDISSTRIRFRGSFSIYSNVLHVSAELTESASGKPLNSLIICINCYHI